jgi:hypothetical protein
MPRNKEPKPILQRIVTTPEDIRFRIDDDHHRSGAAIVGLHPDGKSLTWTAVPSSAEEKVALFLPFLDEADKHEDSDARVEFMTKDGGHIIGERTIADSRKILAAISTIGSNVIHFSLAVSTPHYDSLTLRQNYIEPNSPIVAVHGSDIEPQYIQGLFLSSASKLLRPHFEEIVHDFRHHVVTDRPK